ncbi:major facilitator superfamily transporter [Apiospora arundinis]
MPQYSAPRDETSPLCTSGLSPTVSSFGVPPRQRHNALPPFPPPSHSVETTLGADSEKYRVAAGYWFQMYKQSQAQLSELSRKQVESSKIMPKDPDIYELLRRCI